MAPKAAAKPAAAKPAAAKPAAAKPARRMTEAEEIAELEAIASLP